MKSIKVLKDQLTNAKTIAIVGHENPDMDCLASALSLKKAIYNNSNIFGNKTAIDILIDENVDSFYESVIKSDTFYFCANYEKYDLVICVDCANISRVGKFQEVYNNAFNKIFIDHHENSVGYSDNDIIYKCSSTCELLYILFKGLNLEINNEILELIYSGIITDTVNLTQGAVKVSSYKIVAEIVEKINDMSVLNSIKDYFLKNRSKSNLFLLERALRSMTFYLNDKVAIMKITGEDLSECEATQADTLGIINNAINIKGVYIAILFIKQTDGSYYASIRGKNDVNVSKIALALGGGGHETEAAFSYGKNLSDLKENLLDLCRNVIGDDDADIGDKLFEE